MTTFDYDDKYAENTVIRKGAQLVDDYDSRDELFKKKYIEHVEQEYNLKKQQEKEIQLMCFVMKILIIITILALVYQRAIM